MDVVTLLRAAYLSSAASVLFAFAVPALRSRFLDYGPRSSTLQHKDKPKDSKTESSNAITSLLDSAAKICVPHSWFTSFYAASVILSLFWGAELLVKGPILQHVARYVLYQPQSMSYRQVVVVWIMMFAQGSRRLYECMFISKSSDSRMWFGHWAVGILFYTLTSVAVWIEGVPDIQKHSPSPKDFVVQGPSVRTFVGVILFILASGFQHDCHVYLASLKNSKKTDDGQAKSHCQLPQHPAFNICLTPHYLAECLIYLSLAITAAPRGDWLNWTFVSALAFVAINLGVTAYGTKVWYEKRFGPNTVKNRSRMIPFFY